MTYSELKAKLIEGMTTGVMNYGFDFQVDVVDGEDTGGDGEGEGDGTGFVDGQDLSRKSVQDKLKPKKQVMYRKGKKFPWEIENAASATQRQKSVFAWLKAASGNNLQAVNNKSLPAVPKWQDVEIKS